MINTNLGLVTSTTHKIKNSLFTGNQVLELTTLHASWPRQPSLWQVTFAREWQGNLIFVHNIYGEYTWFHSLRNVEHHTILCTVLKHDKSISL